MTHQMTQNTPTASDLMNAVGFRHYGPPNVLEQLQLPRPQPGPQQVGVRVLAAGLNPADANIRAGRFRRMIRQPFPLIPGSDLAGVVDSVGSEVNMFRPGDAVYGLLPLLKGGAYAEYAVVDASALAPKPASLDFVQAAAVPLAALTTLQALQNQAALQPGQRVLINGASGGVGTFAVQIAKALGLHVTALTSARNLEFVRHLGAEEALDYARLQDAASGLAALDGQMDAVFDCAVNLKFAQAGRWLRRGGSFVSLIPVPDPLGLVQALASGKRYRWLLVKPSRTQLDRISGWLGEGVLHPVIERVLSPAELTEGHRLLESRRVRGKLVMARPTG